MLKIAISLLTVALTILPLIANACDEKVNTNLEPFLKSIYKTKKVDACNDQYLYIPIMYNNQKINSLNLKFGKSIKNSVGLSFFDPTDIGWGDENFGKEGYFLAYICLSQDMLEDAEVTLFYKDVPKPDGSISFCMSTRDLELKKL